jgi:hypothetical protein
MKMSKTLVVQWFCFGSLVLCGFVFAPVRVAAQQGDKAVFGTGSSLAASSDWVDASAFCGQGGTNNCNTTNFDFCAIVSTALGKLLMQLSPAGGVLDARGVLPPPATGNSPENCLSSPFPSSINTQTNPYPITILLPAYTIQLNPINGAGTGTWTLPNNVRLVGAGFETVLLGSSTCCSSAMIEMGSPNSCQTPLYTGIAVEHLQLNTQGSYGGIENECAGLASYVNDVLISGTRTSQQTLGGNGLTIGPGAINSGPYTDVYVVAAPFPESCGTGSFNCVKIGAQTRGLHGATCLGDSTTGGNTGSGSAAIVVNASNNSIQDVHVESFYDGIQIGDTSSSVSNIFVSNIETGTTQGCAGVTNTVHVCGPNFGSNYQCPTNYPPYGSATDTAMVGVSNDSVIVQGVTANTIEDDQTGTLIQGCGNTTGCNPIASGLYVLGRLDDVNSGEYVLAQREMEKRRSPLV